MIASIVYPALKNHAPLVALVVDPEEARALHHLFRTGTEILVAPAP